MKTVWLSGERERNIELCFLTKVEFHRSATIKLVAKEIYNLFVNGTFVCYGPARTAKGYARIDEINLTPYMHEGENTVSVYVTEVNTDTLCFALGNPYFGALLAVDDKEYTTDDFVAYLMKDRIAKVERMSSQRGYLEVYQAYADRNTFHEKDYLQIAVEEVASPIFLQRNVAFATHEKVVATLIESGGAYCEDKIWKCGFQEVLETGRGLNSYPQKECEMLLSKELNSFSYANDGNMYGYHLYDLSRTLCGKIALKVKVNAKSSLWVAYDDLLVDGQIKFGRESIIHGLKWTLEKGEYSLLSAEAYAGRYIAIVFDKTAEVEEVSLLKIENPKVDSALASEDKDLQKVYEASANTFAQNAYDLYTDCPSRERAGWLCDSYFTAKAERHFTGESRVEKNFLENYLLYDGKDFEDEGVLPMCYPSKVRGTDDFIPNWILWYIVELYDYGRETGDYSFVKKHEKKIRAVLAFFEKYENEYGLLENLPGWVFVEWSKANDFVGGVNFPSNMLYYGAIKRAAELLNEQALYEKADKLKREILSKSYTGKFFIDNALRDENGVLRITENVSETCQYYAAFFQLITKEEDSQFYAFIIEELGKFDENPKGIFPSNMFIGYILRLMILLREGEYTRLLEECKTQFLPMAEKTSTLWEHFNASASCNHGFGSIVGYLITEAIAKNKEKEG